MALANHVFSGFAFIGFILVTILLPLHIKARNIGTCAFIIWTGLLCFNGFINSIVWDNNVTNWAPAWCDISSHLMISGAIGVQSACLCIARYLYTITNNACANQSGQSDIKQQWRGILFEYFLVMGIPAIITVLAYIPQCYRFLIYEEIGCYYALFNTPVVYPVLMIWPVTLALLNAVYAGVIVRVLIQRRAHLKDLEQRDRHFRRLLALVVIMFICSVPQGMWTIVDDTTENTIFPWPGWQAMHADISQIYQVPAAVMQTLGLENIVSLQIMRWIYVGYAMIFFAFFGLSTEAKRKYWIALNFVTGRTNDSVISRVWETRRINRFAGRLPAALSTIATQISNRRSFVPVLPLNQPHHTPHDPHQFELSGQKAISTQLIQHQAIRLSGDDSEARCMPSTVSVPTYPSPVLDITSISPRNSSQSHVYCDNSLSNDTP